MQSVYTKEQLEAAINKLESERKELNTEWESADSTARYWIEQSIENVESKIFRYVSLLES